MNKEQIIQKSRKTHSSIKTCRYNRKGEASHLDLAQGSHQAIIDKVGNEQELGPVFPLRCEIYLCKFAATFSGLQRANFSEFLGFGYIAYEFGQLLRFRI